MFLPRIALPVLVFASLMAVTSLSCNAVGRLPSSPASPDPTGVLPGKGAVINETATGVQLVDHDGGYTIDIPSEWLVTAVDSADVDSAVAKIAEDNPDLAQAIKGAQQKTPATFRLIAFDKNHAHYVKGHVPNFNVGVYRDAVAVQAPMEWLIQTSIENMETQVPGLKIQQLATKPNAYGVPIGATESDVTTSSGEDQALLYQFDLFFQTKTALVVITFFTPQSTVAQTRPLFEKIRDGIRLMEP